MSLPPDPHDDDLAEPPAAAPPAAGDAAAAPGPPPSPAYAPRPSPATAASPGTADPADPTRLADPDPGHQGPGTPAAPRDATGRGRLGLMLAGVVAVIAVAGGIVVATGDGDDTAAPVEARTGADDEGARPGEGTASGGQDGAAAPDDAGATAAGDPSPVELAEEFLAAVARRDCAGMIERMTPASYATEGRTAAEAVVECEADEAGTAAVAAAEFDDVELVAEDGDTAVVGVTVTVDRVTSTAELPLRRVDGRWLMDLDPAFVTAPG
ncbi:MAG TPA: hypothetical protein VFZ79_07375 [Acidimicrobiales bacterium]